MGGLGVRMPRERERDIETGGKRVKELECIRMDDIDKRKHRL